LNMLIVVSHKQVALSEMLDTPYIGLSLSFRLDRNLSGHFSEGFPTRFSCGNDTPGIGRITPVIGETLQLIQMESIRIILVFIVFCLLK
jgi:hypothetical protein